MFGELLFLNYSKQYNLDVKIVRPHNFYGARMGFEHVVPQVIKRIYEKESPFKIYGYNQTRSFCYIDDAINALELVMNSDECSGKIVHIGTNIETKIVDLVKNLFDICNYSPKFELVNAPIGSVDRRCPDISLLSELTGYKPKFNLDYGLRESCNWYLNYYRRNKNV